MVEAFRFHLQDVFTSEDAATQVYIKAQPHMFLCAQRAPLGVMAVCFSFPLPWKEDERVGRLATTPHILAWRPCPPYLGYQT